MKFGLLYLPTFVPELDGSEATLFGHMLDQIAHADELGFDSAWLTEHHFHPYGGLVPNPAVFGAAIAQRTRRIRIGVAVSVLPLHHALTLAEDYAMLDVLSKGRLDFGIGKGSVAAEYEQFGISNEHATQMLDEQSDLIVRAWSQPEVEHHGQFFQYPKLTLLPRPVQRPHPPIWVGASKSLATFEWAGQRGYNLMVLPYIVPTDVLNGALDTYRAALTAAGHDPSQKEIFAKFHVFVADNANEARRLGAPAYDNYQRIAGSRTRTRPEERSLWDEHVADYKVIAGSPADCIQRIRHWRDTVGITHLGGTFHFGGLSQAATLRSIELFAREVAPAFQEPVTAPALVGTSGKEPHA